MIRTYSQFQSIFKELFIRCKKLNISLVFVIQCYFLVPKDGRLNFTHYLKIRIHDRRELQNITINHSADIGYKDLTNISEIVRGSHIHF